MNGYGANLAYILYQVEQLDCLKVRILLSHQQPISQAIDLKISKNHLIINWNSCATSLSLSIGRCSNRLQVLHHAPVARSPQSGSIPEGLGLRRAGLVVEDLNCIHVFILAPDVLVHHQWWQAGPHNGSDEGAQLDHIAESLRVGLRNCDEPVRQDGKLTDAAGHGVRSYLLFSQNLTEPTCGEHQQRPQPVEKSTTTGTAWEIATSHSDLTAFASTTYFTVSEQGGTLAQAAVFLWFLDVLGCFDVFQRQILKFWMLSKF